ncbi:hypothetical protein Pmar_PMAR000738 [Perkinsus marinus ATCC 50983]|uniref:BART domain-containing protein n=1 Tax=Perkinsus marinus (strain ATCC 50983 / TXsc) TaxID=423536 RepID=C5KXH1_PERM5|nr:hypothetical protein Pmar_PMAR000738 [Perkinsus marinus ATCC 50983]EER10695.1 hypothetical protein Pmar_PMAR000738 [Perkinsus marinus ATCC 50983]|eukprot:XP_002778900.1 hypothetical protein Pmar_PMAR000738 [Perkinsus marinus ATCC 50983]
MSTEVTSDSAVAAAPLVDTVEEAETQRIMDFFEALELECTSGKFTDAVSKFIFDHADTFDDRELDKDIPLDWYNIFQEYQTLIENEIRCVLKAHEISDEEFATYIEVITEKGAAGNFSSFPAMKWVDIDVKLPKLVSANGVYTTGLFAIDYITAALDFEDFCVMMFQHKVMVAFEVPDDSEELPSGGVRK